MARFFRMWARRLAMPVGRRFPRARGALLAAAFGGIISPTTAQQPAGAIRGMVRDADFEAPVPDAKVLVLETDQNTRTSDQGHYSLVGVAPGTYTLVVSKPGFTRKLVKDVLVSPGGMAEADAWLTGDFTDMQEFVVQDFSIGGATELGVLTLRIEAAELINAVSAELIGQAGVGDAAGALKLVSGATVQDGKYAVVRGLPDRYVNSQMNRVRLPTADADKRAVQLDQFPSALVESIQVAKTFTPDQQGDASGGAVNVILKSVPDERVLSFKLGLGYNPQVHGNDDFLSYKNGGVDYWGMADETRDLPFGVEDAFLDENVDPNDTAEWDAREKHADSFQHVMGASKEESPLFDHSWSVTAGDVFEVGDLRLGFLGSFYYTSDFSHYEDGINDKRHGLAKNNTYTTHGTDTGDRYELYDVTRSEESVLYGGLLSFGLRTHAHELNFVAMRTQSAKDSVLLMNDTRGAEQMSDDDYVYYRNETLRYTERSTLTLQLRGKHELGVPEFGLGSLFRSLSPELDWTLAYNEATMWEPDLRGLIGQWAPADPDDPTGDGTWRNINRPDRRIGRRFWREIKETGKQIQMNGTLPFVQWTDTEGFLKVGWFYDEIERTYEQDSFAYMQGALNTFKNWDGTFRGSSFSELFGDDVAVGINPGATYYQYLAQWPSVVPWQIVKSDEDADYDGYQEIQAYYWMADVPVNEKLSFVGGLRTETTRMETQFRASDGETLYFFQWNQDVLEGDRYGPDEWHLADTTIDRTDVLPALSMAFEPKDNLKFRAAYSETIARPTFKEIAPILQVEYLGSDQFVGNNNLVLSELTNYDLRVEYLPSDGSFFSASWFYKQVDHPIEYATVQIVQSPYVQPFNFPDGWLQGYELEARQELGEWSPKLAGLQVRMNATVIDSKVTVPRNIPGTNRFLGGGTIPDGLPGQKLATARDMKGAPEYLVNASVTYDIDPHDVRLTVFYNLKGDTLIAGEGTSDGYVPNVYATDRTELNVGISKKLSERWKLSFRAKNLLDPEIETVYRSRYISDDATKTSYRKGRSYSVSLSGSF